MKQILTTVLAIMILTIGHSQGVKKQPVTQPKQATVQPTDSVVIKGTYRKDTAKVIAVLYVEDGTVTWVKGYVVVKSFIPQGGQPQATETLVYNQKFEAIKTEDVYDMRYVQWK